MEVRGSNGAFYKVRAAGRPGRELGIGSGGRGRRGPRGPRRGGGRRRGTAGPRCWRLPSARFNGLGGPGSVMFGNKAAGAGSACCPGAPRPEASGMRPGRAGPEARGWGAGAPAKAWPGGGRRRQREAHWDPGAAGPAGLLSASPAASWPTPRLTPVSRRPGALRTLGGRGESGRAGRGACGLGSGRPLRRGERRLGKAGFKGDPRPGGRWEGRVSSQPAAKEVFLLLFFCAFFKKNPLS